jgi:predicted nuclease of predicted toxin-antitoxin system
VVWIRRGNSSTTEIEALLRTHRDTIEALEGDADVGLLVLL